MGERAAYSIGLLCESRLRRGSDNPRRDESAMIEFYFKMLKFRDYRGVDRLGHFFAERDPGRVFTLGAETLNCEQLFLLALDAGIVTSADGLIRLYRDNPKARFCARLQKFNITQSRVHLSEAVFDMLNSGYYGEYLKVVRQLAECGESTSFAGRREVTASCQQCWKEGQVLVLNCRHEFCFGCLEGALRNNPARCPQCHVQMKT
jgi:hypothetical protein